MNNKNSDQYDILRIRRRQNVATKPEFIQLIPFDGFETFENSDDFDTIYASYSLSKAVFRELLEECFGVDEETDNNHISSEHICAYPQIIRLVKLIEEGKAELSLSGNTISLVPYRHN